MDIDDSVLVYPFTRSNLAPSYVILVFLHPTLSYSTVGYFCDEVGLNKLAYLKHMRNATPAGDVTEITLDSNVIRGVLLELLPIDK